MKRIALIIVLLFLAIINAQADGVTNKQLYQTLDSLIEHQQDIIAQKEAHISHIHEGIHGLALTPEQEYTYNMRLYDEYLAFNFDSAYYYINRNLHLPRHPGDYQHFALSAIRMAHILAVSGLFDTPIPSSRRFAPTVSPTLCASNITTSGARSFSIVPRWSSSRPSPARTPTAPNTIASWSCR